MSVVNPSRNDGYWSRFGSVISTNRSAVQAVAPRPVMTTGRLLKRNQLEND